MVRLVLLSVCKRLGTNGSQFQDGSISTLETAQEATTHILRSQFQDGSISTEYEGSYGCTWDNDLNSRMVRLVLMAIETYLIEESESQFQDGSISTLY